MKLGKLDYRDDPRDLRLKVVAPAPPVTLPHSFGYGHIVSSWGMLGNDQYGDCVFAGAAHETMLWNRTAGRPTSFTEASVLADYGACTGFRPNVPSSDQGTDVRQAFGYRRATGIQDEHGGRHRIGAYVRLTPGSWDELLHALYLFLAVGIGVQFPDSAMEQFNADRPWDVVAGARVDGGHYIPVVDRCGVSKAGVLTWGRRQVMTRRFYETYCDEAWVAVTEEELRHGVNRRGLDLTALGVALARIH